MLLKTNGGEGAAPQYLIHVLNAFRKIAADIPDDTKTITALQARPDTLSMREVQILKLAGNGLNNRELAARLFVSEGTIKWHLHNIYVKLDANNHTGAIAKARESEPSLDHAGSGKSVCVDDNVFATAVHKFSVHLRHHVNTPICDRASLVDTIGVESLYTTFFWVEGVYPMDCS